MAKKNGWSNEFLTRENAAGERSIWSISLVMVPTTIVGLLARNCSKMKLWTAGNPELCNVSARSFLFHGTFFAEPFLSKWPIAHSRSLVSTGSFSTTVSLPSHIQCSPPLLLHCCIILLSIIIPYPTALFFTVGEGVSLPAHRFLLTLVCADISAYIQPRSRLYCSSSFLT